MNADEDLVEHRAGYTFAMKRGVTESDLAIALAVKMPNAKAEVLPNAGHLVFLDAPQKFNELMLDFLAK